MSPELFFVLGRSGAIWFVRPLACARGLCWGCFPKLLYEESRPDFVEFSFLCFICLVCASRILRMSFNVRCLWPDWPYFRLRRPVIGVQATDETMTGLLSFGMRLSKGSG